ncbi:hypothetical protein ACFYZ9_23780 [Streptomyces sp. NPDC001691]|uniref:hypothetical protein n=1 Tax=unclassified Streptomyces TaxID=2593676 RepID=UPI001676C529|nr:hypothetical protein [Streptomyces sp. SDr-06]
MAHPDACAPRACTPGQARRLLESTGLPVTFTPLDAPYTMHEPMAQLYVDIVTEWIKALP